MNVYRLCGEVIASELALHPYAAPAPPETPPTLTLTVGSPQAPVPMAEGDVVNAHDVDGRPFITVARAPGGHRVRAHRYADYLVSRDRRHVLCVPFPAAPAPIMAQLFVDRVLPNAVSRGNTPAFHASVVALDGRAAVFMGDPGLGKSTLASALTPGADWLCDDAAVLRVSEGHVDVHPSYPFARLFGDSLRAMGVEEAERASARNDKRRWQRRLAKGVCRVAAVFALGHDGALRFERLRPRDSVAELARHLFRIDPSDRDALIDELSTLERVANLVPVYRLEYPRRYEALAGVCEALATLLSSA